MVRGEAPDDADADGVDHRDPAGATGAEDRRDHAEAAGTDDRAGRDPDALQDSADENRGRVEDPDAADPGDEGWWRYPVATWLGLLTLPVGGVIVGLSGTVDYVVLTQLLGLVGTLVIAPSALAFGLGWFLSIGTVYWGSKHYRDDPTSDWNPNPALYLVVALVGVGLAGLGPLLVGGAWFVQRVRNVGTPEFTLSRRFSG